MKKGLLLFLFLISCCTALIFHSKSCKKNDRMRMAVLSPTLRSHLKTILKKGYGQC